MLKKYTFLFFSCLIIVASCTDSANNSPNSENQSKYLDLKSYFEDEISRLSLSNYTLVMP